MKCCEKHCSDIWAVTQDNSHTQWNSPQNRKQYAHGLPNSISTANGKQSLDPADSVQKGWVAFKMPDEDLGVEKCLSFLCVCVPPLAIFKYFLPCGHLLAYLEHYIHCLLRKFHHDLISSVTFISSVILTTTLLNSINFQLTLAKTGESG